MATIGQLPYCSTMEINNGSIGQINNKNKEHTQTFRTETGPGVAVIGG